ncbi:MAG: zinc-binding alcohol dehydrogenase family protein [Pseudomonadota bacterium]|nr:zinc-binding alcohol dehydrogenase family protein [Pseudomonadota bacterium]
MDVVVCRQPGDLQIERRPIPPRRGDEILIRVRHVGVCGTDMHIFRGTQPYLSYPRVMGHELSGEVVEAPRHSALQAGDPIYVMPYMSCGRCFACRNSKPNCCSNLEVLGVHRDGALAQFVSVPERFVFRADGITLAQAAMIEFLSIGAHAVRRSGVHPGRRVLVSGAGPIGIACALFAQLAGAQLTVLDTRAERLNFCRRWLAVSQALSVGSDTEAQLSGITGGDMFDVVIDATGNPSAMQAGFKYICHGGSYVLVSVVDADITFSDPEFHRREATLMGSRNATAEDFERVLSEMRAGRIPTEALNTHAAPLIELPQIMPTWMDPAAGVIKAIVRC